MFRRRFLEKLITICLWVSALAQERVGENCHSWFGFGCQFTRERGLDFSLVLLFWSLYVVSEFCRFLFFALLLFFAGAIIPWKITVLAKALWVVELLIVLAGPCFLCAAAAVIAVDAHVLGIMFAALVRTGDHLPRLALLAIRAHIRNGLNVVFIVTIYIIARFKVFNSIRYCIL